MPNALSPWPWLGEKATDLETGGVWDTQWRNSYSLSHYPFFPWLTTHPAKERSPGTLSCEKRSRQVPWPLGQTLSSTGDA